MTSPEPKLSVEAIRAAAGHPPDVAVHVFEQLPSTNSWLVEHAPAGSATLCIADQQMTGKGRRGRQWCSEGGGFTCSIRLPLQLPLARAGAFSLVVAIALREAISSLGVEGVGLKWPNDLLHNWRKLSGILLEVARSDDRSVDLVCGAGVNWRPLQQELDQPVIDLHSLLHGLQLDRNLLAGRWLAAMLRLQQHFEVEGFAAMAEQWQAADVLHQAPVRVLRGAQVLDGVARGVDKDGALLVETLNGIEAMHAGEVSLRRR